MNWWSRRGPHATDARSVQRALLIAAAVAWGRRVWHVWDRGFAGSPWIQTALHAQVRFVVRWKKGQRLLSAWGEEQKAWECVRGKRPRAYRMWRDPHTRREGKVGVLVQSVTLVDDPHPLWLVVTRPGKGHESWYLLTNVPIPTVAACWTIVDIYTRRWQIEWSFRFNKSELGFESIRVQKEAARHKLLMLATLVYAFLLSLVQADLEGLRSLLLRVGCHRTGQRMRETEAPLYRLRAALSQLWGAWAIAPPHRWLHVG